MNKLKTEYLIAVAVVMIATAFCGCDDNKDDYIALDEVSLDDVSILSKNLEDDGNSPKNNEGEGIAPDDSKENISEETEAEICIYVCGAVENPGVYKLSGDIRMIDAIDAAGGMTGAAGGEYLNLASRVADGQKIYVPTEKEIEDAIAEGDDSVYSVVTLSPGDFDLVASAAEQNEGEGESGSDLVNINTADKASLMTLPGIGESKAEKIIEYREKNGGFSSCEDLMLISGIKDGLYNKVKDKICVR